ncbi:methyltransferase domain-containing protein [Actinomadura sp. ATCC 31491]|uniref:Methyltransferase domain-containing protein n=1 Tax=Actinomadura luzonensis TaxID=2805427 RepID=A0ABT0FSN4_9ACTN|nr:methyltransferase domain-containing protein [Actinomadura luzonensis]
MAPAPGTKALDVGTGPGTVARVLARAIGPTGAVVGTDPNPAMLTLAAELPAVDGAPIQYSECGATPLHVSDHAFDLITMQQVLQFVPDRGAALAELRRAARPGARIAIATWQPLHRNPLFRALHDAVATVLGPDLAALFEEPWSLPGTEVATLAKEVGFVDVELRDRTLPTTVPGGPDALCCLFDFSAISPYAGPRRADLVAAVRANLAHCTDAAGVHSETAATLVTARA